MTKGAYIRPYIITKRLITGIISLSELDFKKSIYASKNNLVTRKEIDSYYQLFSNVEIIDIEEAGHFLFLEKPQLVADIVNDNLSFF